MDSDKENNHDDDYEYDKRFNKDNRKKRFKNKNKLDKYKHERQRNWEKSSNKIFRPKFFYDPEIEEDEDEMWDF